MGFLLEKCKLVKLDDKILEIFIRLLVGMQTLTTSFRMTQCVIRKSC